MQDAKRTNNPLYLVLFLGTFLAGLSISNFVPAMLSMAKFLGAPANDAQLTLPAFLFSFAFAQLFYGTISDRFGRRGPYLFGIILYMIGALLCFFSHHMISFIIGRFLQGAGIGCSTVLAVAILHDLNTDNIIKTFSNMMIIAIVGFITSPVLVYYLGTFLPWQMIYLLLAIYAGILAILAMIYLRETNLYVKTAKLQPTFFRKTYLNLLADRRFMGYLITSCLLFCMPLIVFCTMPILLATAFQLSTVSFTWLSLINVGFYLFGIYLGYLLTGGVKSHHVITLGIFIMVVSSAGGLLLGALEIIKLDAIYLPTCFILLGAGLSLPCTLGTYVPNMKSYPGTTISLQLFCLALLASFINYFNAILSEDDQIPLMGVFLITSLITLLVYWLIVPNPKHIASA